MSLAIKIKTLRKKHKLTQSDLAKKLGIAPTAVSAWENNLNKPLMDKLAVMADLFDVPVYYFFDDLQLESTGELVYLPIYGNVSCGDGLVVFDPASEFMEVPKKWISSEDYFVLIAKGDSMIGANIKEGDELIIRKQEEVENGEIAVVVIGDKLFLKRVYKSDSEFMLVSENPNFPPVRYHPETNTNIRIVGKLKKAITNFM